MDGRWLDKILGHVGGTKCWAAGLCLQFSVNVDAFLEQDALEKRVFVAQHEALIGSIAVSTLQVVQVGLVDTDGLLELLDVLGTALTEGSLGLSVSLLALLRSSINLFRVMLAMWAADGHDFNTRHTGLRPPFLLG